MSDEKKRVALELWKTAWLTRLRGLLLSTSLRRSRSRDSFSARGNINEPRYSRNGRSWEMCRVREISLETRYDVRSRENTKIPLFWICTTCFDKNSRWIREIYPPIRLDRKRERMVDERWLIRIAAKQVVRSRFYTKFHDSRCLAINHKQGLNLIVLDYSYFDRLMSENRYAITDCSQGEHCRMLLDIVRLLINCYLSMIGVGHICGTNANCLSFLFNRRKFFPPKW